MKRIILRGDAVFLGLAGIFGLVSDLLSHYGGSGSFGTTFYRNPLVIGVVEAHSLAILTAATMWYFSKKHTATFGNWAGLSAHLICGISNILWFDVFISVGAAGKGMAITALHFVFAALNALVILKMFNTIDHPAK
ncbi:MAG: hypothetical protein H7070_15445 [Saprospiraceae bacterium]|nr:hypothetical protein [Pyrinomonadaceae bacterium]